MRILAVMGSYRKGRCVDKLVDEAIAGALSAGDAEVDKVTLIERRIEYCRNCLTCRDNPTSPSTSTNGSADRTNRFCGFTSRCAPPTVA